MVLSGLVMVGGNVACLKGFEGFEEVEKKVYWWMLGSCAKPARRLVRMVTAPV